MLGGENIGRAYIEIVADGDGLDESIRREFDESEPSVREAGREHGKQYGTEFDREVRKTYKQQFGRTQRELFKDVNKGLTKELARLDYADRFFKSKSWDKFRRRMEEEGGDAGTLFARRLEQQFRDSGNLEHLSDAIKQAGPGMRKAQADILKRLASDQAKFDKEARQQERDAMSAFKRDLGHLTTEMGQLSRGEKTAAYNKTQLVDKIGDLRRSYSSLIDSNVNVRESYRDLNREANRMHPILGKLEKKIGGFSDSIGKAFGHGSRNDFINILGSIPRAVARIPIGIAKIGTSVSDMFHVVDEEGNRAFSLFAGLGRSLGATAGILGGAFAFVGPMISMLSLAAGAVTALASTLATGLVAGAAAASGAIIGLAGLVGGAVIGFSSLSGEAKKSAGEVAKAYKGLGKEIAKGMTIDRRPFVDELPGIKTVRTFDQQMKLLKGHAQDFVPMLRHLGQSISDTTDKLLDFLDTKRWDRFVEKMTGTQGHMGFLANSANKMGDIVESAFEGMTGVIQGLIPVTNRFLGWLQGVGREFAHWATSKQGIQDMQRWLADAGDSARELGGFLGAVGDLLGTLISTGNEAGDSLFQSMTSTVNGWNDFLSSAQGQNALQDWFGRAADFGRAIGNVIKDVGQLGNVLDNTFSRNIATGAIKAIGVAIQGITWPLRQIAQLFGTSGDKAEAWAGQMAGAAIVLGPLGLGGKISKTKTQIGGLVTGLKNTETRMARISSAARTAGGVAGIAAIGIGASSSNKAIQALGEIGGATMLGFSAGGPIGAAVGAFAGTLGFVIGGLDDTADSAKNAQPPLASFADTMDSVTGATTQATRALALQKLQRENAIDAGKQFGISARDLVSASLGEHGAIKRVNAALKDQPDLLKSLTARGILEDIGRIRDDFKQQKGAVDEAQAAITSWKEALKGLPPKVATKVEADGMDITTRELSGLIRKYDLTPKQVKTIVKATDLDLTRGQIDRLTTDYKGIPPKVETKLDAVGWNITAAQVAGLREEYDLTPKNVSTIVKASGVAKTHEDVKALVKEILNYGKQHPHATLDATGKPGELVIDRLGKELTGWGKAKGTATGDVDPKPAQTALAGLGHDLLGWNSKRGTATGDLDGGPAGNVFNSIFGRLGDWGRATASAKANVEASGALVTLDNLQNKMDGLLDKTVTITTNYVSTGSGKMPAHSAEGRITTGPMYSLIGEAGPEAVVPLNRPLSQVDPAVRMLSAFAQGKLEGLAGGGVASSPGKTFNVEQHIYTRNEDPRAVASETVNRLVATGY